MNEVDKKRLEEMQAEARTVPLSEKERWLIGQLEAEAAEVERLMVLATRYNDERITAEFEVERLRGENKRQFRQIQDLCNTGLAQRKRIEALEGRVRELREVLEYIQDHTITYDFEKRIAAALLSSAIERRAPKRRRKSRE